MKKHTENQTVKQTEKKQTLALSKLQNIVETKTLSMEQKLNVSQLISMIEQSEDLNLQQINTIDRMEEQLEVAQPSTNVISFKNYQHNPFPLYSANNKDSACLNFSFLIETPNKNDVFKLAIEIHHLAKRYAMLPFSDLSADALENPKVLKAMGGVTIFIEDICLLSVKQQIQLAEYFKLERDKDCPQIVAGTQKPLAELKEQNLVNESLLKSLLAGYIRLQGDFAQYKKSELLQFFFNQLTGRQS